MVVALASPAWAIPLEMPYHGRVTSGGNPFTGELSTAKVRIYKDASSTAQADLVWESPDYTAVPVTGGVLRLVLASGTPALDTGLLASDNLHLQLWVNGTGLMPRQQLSSMPFAIQASHTEMLDSALPEEFVLHGADAAFSTLQASGMFTAGSSVKLGFNSDACTSGNRGALRFNTPTLKVQVCAGTGWTDLAKVGDLTSASWAQITNKPAGFQDDTDNVFSTVYQAGIGVIKSGTTFSVNNAIFQRRVEQTCPSGQVISSVAVDGTVMCRDAGLNYTAPAIGGLVINGLNEVRIKTCNPGQLMKHNGTGWDCANDAFATSFSALTGQLTDAQVPDNVTLQQSTDSDKVDGQDYSPVWDSTDALSLGGIPAANFAAAADVQTVVDNATAYTTNPGWNQALNDSDRAKICQNSLPTDICRRDVHVAGATPSMDQNSIMRLSGGTWSYNAMQQRCEYSGGVSIVDAEMCGKGNMPAWMDTSDECGGFRQSTWDTRIYYAVAKQNFWDPTFNYNCPAGFRPMTTQEGKETFRGTSSGARVYQHQCGWNGTTFLGKSRTYFRFGDSWDNQGSFKNTTHSDGQGISTDTTQTNFAGIICISESAPGPLDWMLTVDECNGFKQSEFDARVYYAVARQNFFNRQTNYQCPAGYHWATTAEAFNIFSSQAVNEGTTYQDKCGWSGIQAQNDGIIRRYFRFSDSFSGATTLAAKDARQGEMFAVRFGISDDPAGDATGSGAFAGIVCIADSYTPPATDWMDTTDYCGGFRVSSWDPRFAFAVSKDPTWNPNRAYTCPAGWHWATVAEVDSAFQATEQSTDQLVYQGQCGWDDTTSGTGPRWKGVGRRFFRLKHDTLNISHPNRYMDSIDSDSFRGTTGTATTSFAGIVCAKDAAPNYPNAGTLDWMETDDDCKGFRESNWDPRVRFAVARQNEFRPTFNYTCPAGYSWATSQQYTDLGFTSNNTPYKKYQNQCGWSSNNWQGRTRQFFYFRDTQPLAGSGLTQTKTYVQSQDGDPMGTANFGAAAVSTANFAGIVCIRDAAPPADWWIDKSDNCEGFRQSQFNHRVFYAVARKNVWQKTPSAGPSGITYTCPAGFTWIDAGFAAGVFESGAEYNTAATQAAGRVYVSQCGWTGQTGIGTQAAIDEWWHGLPRFFFRFSDSATGSRYIDSRDADGFFNTTAIDGGTGNFAGIVCYRQVDSNPLGWVDDTDNCGGFRQSTANPNFYYQVSKGTLWDRDRVYNCPSGYVWASSAEVNGAWPTSPALATLIYQGECGWNGNNWNAGWNRGCNAYTDAGCGSNHTAPSPTHGELLSRASDFERGCTQCLAYDGNTCDATGIVSGPDGKCGGIDEAFWRNGSFFGDCFFSTNSFSGNPANMAPQNAFKSDHCVGGVCCSNRELQLRTNTRRWFRFSDSTGNNLAMDANAADNSVPVTANTVEQFAGIVCRKL